MATNWLTDEAVEREIARLTESDYVRLARKEVRLKYKRRQVLYSLRNLEKRGRELASSGITFDNIEAMIAMADEEAKNNQEGTGND